MDIQKQGWLIKWVSFCWIYYRQVAREGYFHSELERQLFITRQVIEWFKFTSRNSHGPVSQFGVAKDYVIWTPLFNEVSHRYSGLWTFTGKQARISAELEIREGRSYRFCNCFYESRQWHVKMTVICTQIKVMYNHKVFLNTSPNKRKVANKHQL